MAAPPMVTISKGSAFRIDADVAAVRDEHAEDAAQGDDPADDDEHDAWCTELEAAVGAGAAGYRPDAVRVDRRPGARG